MKGVRWLAIVLPVCWLSACAAPHVTAPSLADRHVLDYGDRDYGRGGQVIQPVSVYASSNYADTIAADALNPAGNTQWASGGYQERRAWWVADLGTESAVNRVSIKTGDLGGATYRLELSDNGVDWHAVTDWMASHSWYPVDLPIHATGRYLRVQFQNDDFNPIPRFAIYQITVYGHAGPFYSGGPAAYSPDF